MNQIKLIKTNIGQIKNCRFKAGNTVLTIHAETWAPGIWAGTEGMRVFISNQEHTVIGVDIEHRKVIVKGEHFIPANRSIFSNITIEDYL